MNQAQVSILVVLFSLLLVTHTQTASLEDFFSLWRPGMPADVRFAELQAWIAFGGNPLDNDCNRVACGVVDVYASGKKKRDPQYASVSDEERYNLLKALLQRAAIENTSS